MIAAANARTNADVQNYMIHLGVGAEEFCDAQEEIQRDCVINLDAPGVRDRAEFMK